MADPTTAEADGKEKAEIDLFLQALDRCYGYDFRSYAQASIRRRVRRLREKSGLPTISDMIPKLVHDQAFAASAIQEFSIAVTEMFRDADCYRALRKEVVPYLRTYPFIRVWHVGCATGEEVYSLAIVLQEEGLYDRATIFATDFNEGVLEKAREGIYGLKEMRQYTENYFKAGGSRSLADYYHARYDSVIMRQSLKVNLTFANHNLVTDGVFGEMHLILCRNVLIYFGKMLQNRVLRLIADSLIHSGFLCLGSKELLDYSEVSGLFKVVDRSARIYQKTAL
jgi:chemotaxis protein methyltransferase CheR